MFRVKDFMTSDVICTEKDATISEIIDLMKEKGIHRLPVVENERLVGLITEGMISNANSQATSLSIYELNYLLSKTTVKTIMVKDVKTANEEDLMEDATARMLGEDIGCLPVIDKEGKVTGILTQNDVFKCFLNVLGWQDRGSRLSVAVKDEVGAVQKLSGLFADLNINITHLGVYANEDGIANMVIRCDADDTSALCRSLEHHGYHVLKSEQTRHL